MDSAKYDLVADLFAKVIEMPEGDRSGWLTEACDDSEVVAMVQEMLVKDDELHSTAIAGSTRGSLAGVTGTIGGLPPDFGDYDRLEEIGRGGLGVIYRARQLSLNRSVAIKTIQHGPHASAEQLLRFRMEAEAAARLDHPNIVPIYEVGAYDDQPFFSMKLIEGTNLAAWLKTGSPTIEDKVDVLIKSARALHYAHQNGVLHRDVKPGNILIDRDTEPHLTDFGLAKQLEVELDLTVSGQIMGTPSYMSPEQASAENRSLTVATDIYGLGAILYVCLTGKPPFKSDSMFETLKQVVETDPATPRSVNQAIDADLETICLRCLRKDPAKRYASAGDFADDLARWRNGEPIKARPVGPIERAVKWARRRPAVAATLSALVTTIVIAAIVVVSIRADYAARQRKNQAVALVNALETADPSRVEGLVESLDSLGDLVEPVLRQRIEQAEPGSTAERHLSLALLPYEPQRVKVLGEQIFEAPLPEWKLIRSKLPNDEETVERFWAVAESDDTGPEKKFRALAVLANLAPDDERWESKITFALKHLTEVVPTLYLQPWIDEFRPIAESLIGPSSELLIDRENADAQQRERAAFILADYLRDDPKRLADTLLLTDEPFAFRALADALRPGADQVQEYLVKTLTQTGDGARDDRMRRRALAGAALAEFEFVSSLWPLLKHSSDPSLRSLLIKMLTRFDIDGRVFAERLALERDVTVRRALLQILSGVDPDSFAPNRKASIASQLSGYYRTDPDPGVHGAALSALRRWKITPAEVETGIESIEQSQAGGIRDDDPVMDEIRGKIESLRKDIEQHRDRWESRMAKAEAAEIPNEISRYRFDEDEVRDEIGGNPGSYRGEGQVERVAGLVGGAIRLNGRGGLECENDFTPEFDEPFSYGCWVQTVSVTHYGAVFSRINYEMSRGFDLWINDGMISAHVTHAHDEMLKLVGKEKLLVGQWQHLFVTYDGSGEAPGMRLFVDGEAVDTTIHQSRIGNTIRWDGNFFIGKRYDPDSVAEGNPFQGTIDDIRLFDRRLSDEEVQNIFQDAVAAVSRTEQAERTPEQVALLERAYEKVEIEALEDQLADAEWELRRNRWRLSRRWYASAGGPTMCVLTEPAREGAKAFSRSFAISMHPITVGQYLPFRGEVHYDRTLARSPDCPIHHVSWRDAAAYCNWLSEKEQIPEDQWCYHLSPEGTYGPGMGTKPNYLQLDGYRLPTMDEWRHACRADTLSYYFFGDSPEMLSRYGWSIANSQGVTHPVGSFLPNDYGLFDTHGGLWEWCQEGEPSNKRLAGGAFNNPAHTIGWMADQSSDESTRLIYYGFRVARSIR